MYTYSTRTSTLYDGTGLLTYETFGGSGRFKTSQRLSFTRNHHAHMLTHMSERGTTGAAARGPTRPRGAATAAASSGSRAAVDHCSCRPQPVRSPPPRWGERRGEGRCKCTSPSLNLAHTSISRLETRRPLAGLGGDGAGGDEVGGNEQMANEQAASEQAVIEEAVTGGDRGGMDGAGGDRSGGDVEQVTLEQVAMSRRRWSRRKSSRRRSISRRWSRR